MTYSSLHPATITTGKSLRRLLSALVITLALGLSTAQTASAQIPQRLAYQSLVSNLDGQLASDGAYLVTFRLYVSPDASGEPLWSEQQSVSLQDGLLSTFLGSKKALDLPFDRPYYLTVQLHDQDESPAMPLSTAAYALKAQDVQDGAGAARGFGDGDASSGCELRGQWHEPDHGR